ncbi:MAG: manganese efflux pump [Bacteroidetes bacterium]|nr:manganese efflux pump [Bacteroidota bacterium]
MGLLSIFLIGIGLSVDSFVVSITAGVCMVKVKLKNALKVALFMAVFQALMPLIGWLAGSSFQRYIESFDHWVAFVLLLAIGSKMIYEGVKHKDKAEKSFPLSNNLMLTGMAMATSIDALIVGIGFGLLEVSIIIPVLIIGGLTFLFSALGFLLGNKIGTRYNSGLEIFGGIILAGLGINILVDHILFV